MLILLFLFTIFHHLQGAPLSADNGGSIAASVPAPDILPRVGPVYTTRSPYQIAISCLTTILACTWTAIHPNIPSPTESRWEIFKRRVVTTIYALLAPEFVALLALRQRLGAKRIMADYNSNIAKQTMHSHGPQRQWYQKPWVDFKEWLFFRPPFHPIRIGEPQEWTTTHGFFVQMGGFVLRRNGIPAQAMSFSKSWIEADTLKLNYIMKYKDQPDPADGIKELILSGLIDPPTITEVEIKDRSKGDIISKAFVILQTTWFIVQCVARWSNKLPLVELEIVTLGFAMLNGLTYALWWHKPQNVGVPVYLDARVQLLTKSLNNNNSLVSSNPEMELGIELPQMNTGAASRNQTTEELEQLVPQELEDTTKPSFLSRRLKDDWDDSNCIKLMFLIPWRLLQTVLRPLVKLRQAECDYIRKGDLRVPMFFSEPVEDRSNIVKFICFVATLCACVQMIPSYFIPYLSDTIYKNIWRVSLAFITTQPLYWVLVLDSDVGMDPDLPHWIQFIGYLSAMVVVPLYIVCRLALIILSFLLIGDLSDRSGARTSINFIASIPHLH